VEALLSRLLRMRHFFGQQKGERVVIPLAFLLRSVRHHWVVATAVRRSDVGTQLRAGLAIVLALGRRRGVVTFTPSFPPYHIEDSVHL